MTDTRVDHAEEARIEVKYALDALRDGDDGAAAAIAAVGQVKATLALVEQQRIANLIAVANVRANDSATANRAAVEVGEVLGL